LSVGATQDRVTDFVVEPVEPLGGGDPGIPDDVDVDVVDVVDVVAPSKLEVVVLVAIAVPPLDGAEVTALVPLAGLEPLLGHPASSTQAAPIKVSCARDIRSKCIMVWLATLAVNFGGASKSVSSSLNNVSVNTDIRSLPRCDRGRRRRSLGMGRAVTESMESRSHAACGARRVRGRNGILRAR